MNTIETFGHTYALISTASCIGAATSAAGHLPPENPIKIVEEALKLTRLTKTESMIRFSCGILTMPVVIGFFHGTLTSEPFPKEKLIYVIPHIFLEMGLSASVLFLSLWFVHAVNKNFEKWIPPESKMLGDKGIPPKLQLAASALLAYSAIASGTIFIEQHLK
ncbi:MAG: hypothetical protein IPJ69_08685 [Deltaproteobacteria bacterium]|nr:MAG: hypothetical protein IPJ69_08685 [Deltaproteobacteria bacterium]